MVNWELRFERLARKDAKRLEAAGLKVKADSILTELERDPYYVPPPFEKLIGDLSGFFSRRVNRQHRIVYEIDSSAGQVVVHRMYSHYGE